MAQRQTKTRDDDAVTVRRRMPAEERRADMIARAATHFARHGFSSPTRALAADMGVTQALIYRHFGSKSELVDRTLETVLGQATGQGPQIDRDVPAEVALTGFYGGFVARMTETTVRLFVRAGLDGRRWPTRRGDTLTRSVFLPVIAVLRREAGLPGLEARAPMRGERELAMMLHAAMVFFGIRRYVYNMPMPESLEDVVAMQVRVFVAGAIPELRRLHDGDGDSLTVRLLAPGS